MHATASIRRRLGFCFAVGSQHVSFRVLVLHFAAEKCLSLYAGVTFISETSGAYGICSTKKWNAPPKQLQNKNECCCNISGTLDFVL